MDTASSPSELAPAYEAPPERGIYVYSIVECSTPRSFGKIGIGSGDEVYTVHYKDLAAVVSRTPLMVYDPTRENAFTHEHVNQVTIGEGLTPVPMSFGTLFKTEKDIVEFLEDTYDALYSTPTSSLYRVDVHYSEAAPPVLTLSHAD